MQSIANLEIPIKVKDDIETSINALLAKFRFNINKIILFGSFATGKYQPDSDIDIMVVLNELPDIKHRRLYKQAIDLENIDLLFCSKNQLSNDNLVFKRVNEKGLVLYEQL